MNLGDVLFLLAALGTVIVIVRIVWACVRRRFRDARRIGVRWLAAAFVYVVALVTVSFTQSSRVIAAGQPECFDDWCLTVERSERLDAMMRVTLQISNRGAGRPQAEPDAMVYLRDERGNTYLPNIANGNGVHIGDVVLAGSPNHVVVEFALPETIQNATLVKTRRSKFPAPFIIGDAESFLHQPTVHVLK